MLMRHLKGRSNTHPGQASPSSVRRRPDGRALARCLLRTSTRPAAALGVPSPSPTPMATPVRLGLASPSLHPWLWPRRGSLCTPDGSDSEQGPVLSALLTGLLLSSRSIYSKAFGWPLAR